VRQRVEEELRESEKKLAQFLEAVPVGCLLLMANPTTLIRLHRYTAGNLTEATAAQLNEIYQAYLAGTEQLYPTEQQPIIRAGESVTIDDIEIHQADNVIPFEVSHPNFDDKGRIIYAIAAFQNISQRKAEAEIQFTKELALKNCSAAACISRVHRTLEQKSRSALKNCHKR